LKILGFFLVVAIATIFSGGASVAGAEAGGWQQSQWAIMIAAPLFFGWIAGFILSILSFVFLRSIRGYREALVAGFVCPPAATFAGAFIIYFITLFPHWHAEQRRVVPNTPSIRTSGSSEAPSSIAY